MTEETPRISATARPAPVKSPKHGADSPATSPAYRDAMSSTAPPATHVVVVGAGMVAHRFAESLLSRAGDEWRERVVIRSTTEDTDHFLPMPGYRRVESGIPPMATDAPEGSILELPMAGAAIAL